jgi:hypothetical protein
MTACRCSRCSDPTENGSHVNTVLCQKCCNDDSGGNPSNMLPVQPLEYDSEWRCEKCSDVRVGADVENMVNGLLGILDTSYKGHLTHL